MKITITKVKENADGSADIDVHYDDEGLKFLLEKGLNASLTEAVMMEKTGEMYDVCDVLGTLPKKSSKKSGRKSVAKIEPARKRRSTKGSA